MRVVSISSIRCITFITNKNTMNEIQLVLIDAQEEALSS